MIRNCPESTMMTRRTTLSILGLLVALATFLAPVVVAEETSATALLPIPNARIPLEGVLSGGQPTTEQIEAAARAGFRTVINLRTDQESGFEWEREAVEGLGMRYVQIPVAGADGLTHDNIELIDAALREARQSGPVLLHCGSGNRIGAVLALRAAWLQKIDAAEALDYGLASGLTRLEGKTRELLDLK
jgi:uncharacterized protein (TIGR01244 family)